MLLKRHRLVILGPRGPQLPWPMQTLRHWSKRCRSWKVRYIATDEGSVGGIFQGTLSDLIVSKSNSSFRACKGERQRTVTKNFSTTVNQHVG